MLQGEERPGIVHRLDMDKYLAHAGSKSSDEARAFQDHQVQAKADAMLVQGYASTRFWQSLNGIAQRETVSKMIWWSDAPGAREAIASIFRTFDRLKRAEKASTASECHLYTGRYNVNCDQEVLQHAPAIGHPCC